MFLNHERFLNNFLIFSFGALGFVALIFQVAFVKKLILLFGMTAPAVASVLAIFFFGLALGSFLFGKLSDKFFYQKKILWLYALLFVITGIYGLIFPLIFKLLNYLILTVNNFYPLNFSGFNFSAFLFSFLFLAPVAIMFGAGFPIISKIFIHEENLLGRKISLLYFVNTFGGVFGATLAGFWLIPSFGNNATIFIAAGFNLAVAGILFSFARSISGNSAISDQQFSKVLTKDGKIPSVQSPIFFYALLITGFLALALEVLYTKTLILFIGSSTYSFSLILITFLSGLAAGSLVFSFFADKIRRGYAYFGVCLALMGFWLFLTAKFFEKIPFWYLDFLKKYETFDFAAILSSQFLVIFLVIFPATFLMGIIFPLGIKLAAPDFKKLGQEIGKLYFANTLGGVFGSLAAGFLFLPAVGYHRTLILIVLIYFTLAGVFIIKEKNLDRLIKGFLIFFLIFWSVFGIFSSPWSRSILSMGAFPYARTYVQIDPENFYKAIKGDKILFYKEGLSNVAVIQRGGETFLRVNGKSDAGNSLGDLEAEILIGALPMLFHPAPKDVLVIGLGSGVTLGTVTRFDEAKSIDTVEIDPAIVEASNYFKKDNHDALSDPRVKTILADGRNHLLLSDKKYDVISSEPSNLWVTGNAALFTKEFYNLAKSRLNEDGIMLQWIYAYNLESENVKSVIKTFQSIFPQAYLFSSISGGDLFLVGSISDKPILDFSLLENKFSDPKIQEELGRLFITNPYELLSHLVSGNERLEEYVKGAEIHTDDNSFLEFSAPKTIYADTLAGTLEELALLFDKSNQTDLIVGGDHEKLARYFEFSKNLIPVKIALNEKYLFDMVDAYKSAKEFSGLTHNLLEAYVLRSCNIFASIAASEGRQDLADSTWEKCSELFNTIEVGI